MMRVSAASCPPELGIAEFEVNQDEVKFMEFMMNSSLQT